MYVCEIVQILECCTPNSTFTQKVYTPFILYGDFQEDLCLSLQVSPDRLVVGYTHEGSGCGLLGTFVMSLGPLESGRCF